MLTKPTETETVRPVVRWALSACFGGSGAATVASTLSPESAVSLGVGGFSEATGEGGVAATGGGGAGAGPAGGGVVATAAPVTG